MGVNRSGCPPCRGARRGGDVDVDVGYAVYQEGVGRQQCRQNVCCMFFLLGFIFSIDWVLWLIVRGCVICVMRHRSVRESRTCCSRTAAACNRQRHPPTTRLRPPYTCLDNPRAASASTAKRRVQSVLANNNDQLITLFEPEVSFNVGLFDFVACDVV